MTESDDQLRSILYNSKNVAVVGLSPKPERDSNSVAAYLIAAGYNVIPINPVIEEVLGLKSYASLEDVPVPIDIVDVFRRPENIPDIARSAVAVGAKVLWTQLNIVSEEGVQIASAAGLQVVMDRCTLIEHRRLICAGG
jgi:predicted CoA-binding protein